MSPMIGLSIVADLAVSNSLMRNLSLLATKLNVPNTFKRCIGRLISKAS